MAEIINRYFNKNQINEQGLLNSLVKESIQVQGKRYYYLPRNSQVRDLVLGEDTVSSFDLAIPIEMYLSDSQGFQGQKEMFSKFGLQINNSYKLVMSQSRWQEETGSTQRPHEGDLVFDPLTKFLMEIKFVDHDVEFFALGKNYSYYLSCEAFMYQNETIATSVPEIDFFSTLSRDILNFQILTQSGLILTKEDGEYILLESEPVVSTREIGVDFSVPALKLDTIIVNDPFNM